MTTFYPYQWDLNYRNPVVFNEMMFNFLYLANRGVDVLRIDAVPYIWKELGTDCRNLPRVHTIVRMMRMIGEIVCPGILLLGEVVMEPEKVAPYFGTVEKPECHMLYNVTTMAAIWNTAATKDVRLLKSQMETVSSLPSACTFLNYLRCHDDIGWGLDYPLLERWGMRQVPHKKFLNDFFTGRIPESFSRGVLYNDDPATGDARFCGTTASMCGVEKAGFCHDRQAMEEAVRLDTMLHAFMLFQSGIPVLYSGDEVGQVNDYTYKDNPEKAPDSRYIHRGEFQWDLVERINEPETVQNRIFHNLEQLEAIRAGEPLLDAGCPFRTLETWDNSVLGMVRQDGRGKKLIGLFNFSGERRTAWIDERDGMYGICYRRPYGSIRCQSAWLRISVDEASVRMTKPYSAVLLSSHRQFTRKPLKIPASSYEDISELSRAALLISRVKQAVLPEQARVNSSVTCSLYFGEPSPRSMRS